MNHVGRPNMLGDFDGRAAELTVTLGVVGIIARGSAVEAIAIKIHWVVNEKITHSANHGTVRDGRKTEARPAHRNRDTGHDYGANLRSAVAGQHHRDFVPEAD